VSAVLLRTETVRALRRSGNDHHVGNARRLFAAIHLIRIDEPLLDLAGDLRPTGLRSLDAIHLAAALSIVPDLGSSSPTMPGSPKPRSPRAWTSNPPA
jgi:predicted nucleic acid-binding protein